MSAPDVDAAHTSAKSVSSGVSGRSDAPDAAGEGGSAKGSKSASAGVDGEAEGRGTADSTELARTLRAPAGSTLTKVPRAGGSCRRAGGHCATNRVALASMISPHFSSVRFAAGLMRYEAILYAGEKGGMKKTVYKCVRSGGSMGGSSLHRQGRRVSCNGRRRFRGIRRRVLYRLGVVQSTGLDCG